MYRNYDTIEPLMMKEEEGRRAQALPTDGRSHRRSDKPSHRGNVLEERAAPRRIQAKWPVFLRSLYAKKSKKIVCIEGYKLLDLLLGINSLWELRGPEMM